MSIADEGADRVVDTADVRAGGSTTNDTDLPPLEPAPPPGLRIPRLEEVLGCRLDQMTVAVVQRLCREVVAEDQTLDIKASLYAPSAAGAHEIAKDVAAMANADGGLIIRGVAEDGQGRAAYLAPVPLSESERRRMHEAVRNRISPWVPDFYIGQLAVDAASATGYYLIAVPASDMAPHGILIDNGQPDKKHSTAWPIRIDRETAWLREPQIAARYRDRFDAINRQDRRLIEITAEGAKGLDVTEGPWLSLAVAPARPGRMAPGRRTVDDTRSWLQDVLTTGGSVPTRLSVGGAGVGRRRVVISDALAHIGPSKGHRIELHADGGAFAAVSLLGQVPHHYQRDSSPTKWINAEDIEAWTVTLLCLLARHAVRAGAGGDLVVQVQLARKTWSGLRNWPTPDGPEMTPPKLAITEIQLLGGTTFRATNIVPASISLDNPTAAVTTVPLTVAVNDGDLVSAAAGIVADLLGEFSVRTPRLLQPNGLVWDSDDLNPTLLSWARDRGVVAQQSPH
jgi:hypothetical protein